ncbi:uncharacterized protein BX663DRAFT_496026 [Cokeromyces recurvatus]|uniref:uncharacterized protein n=1 Tax=Cokeromyces recurvatus TaxID=90255 RepID=UPI0022209B2F|nr:uncharacterized protein BX663DRAFT_496026 [Cokeromyces recurvatus]KAI7906325.1 hypothetical protein BX663DRAFT_496026 [Cokeromyces recurvatus]
MLIQPNLQDDEQRKIQDKIKKLKNKLNTDDVTRKDNKHLLDLLNIEYKKLSELRFNQNNLLKSSWDDYQLKQRQTRRKETEKRLIEAERIEQLEYEKRLENRPEVEIYDQLLALLLDDTSSSSNNSSAIKVHNDVGFPTVIDTSIVIIPVEVLDLFWSVDVPIPSTKSEIPLTIETIKQRKASLLL